MHNCQLHVLQIFCNYYEFFQELQKYELLFKIMNFKFSAGWFVYIHVSLDFYFMLLNYGFIYRHPNQKCLVFKLFLMQDRPKQG